MIIFYIYKENNLSRIQMATTTTLLFKEVKEMNA